MFDMDPHTAGLTPPPPPPLSAGRGLAADPDSVQEMYASWRIGVLPPPAELERTLRTRAGWEVACRKISIHPAVAITVVSDPRYSSLGSGGWTLSEIAAWAHPEAASAYLTNPPRPLTGPVVDRILKRNPGAVAYLVSPGRLAQFARLHPEVHAWVARNLDCLTMPALRRLAGLPEICRLPLPDGASLGQCLGILLYRSPAEALCGGVITVHDIAEDPVWLADALSVPEARRIVLEALEDDRAFAVRVAASPALAVLGPAARARCLVNALRPEATAVPERRRTWNARQPSF
jgi:hypothetical protein